jgi:predicted trehalose synthase
MTTKKATTKKARAFSLGEDKKANFKNFAGKRTQRVIRSLKALSNCGNRTAYEADTVQVDKIEKALQEALADCMKKLRNSPKDKAKEFTLE